ncbi:hypothetical protein D915_011153 [Fasciola hepatica]|uniref:Uncharacterized protein n=1 Tax=Fasciola hepatica TaxID=6192 RepID=A0A4E0QXU5_FASHE|nr:hypothetical protein D915_011153 [Fasciola hepatica]
MFLFLFSAPRLQKRNRGRPRRRGDASGENTSGNTNPAIGTTGAEIVPKRTRKGSLPLELTHYLGEAERFLNSGHFDEAEEICQNVISQGKTLGHLEGKGKNVRKNFTHLG